MSVDSSPEEKQKSTDKFAKNFRNLSLLTFLSRIFGMLRETTKAYFLGVSLSADAFSLAFAIPNLFRRLTAEGVTLNSFIPSLTEVDSKEGKKGMVVFFAGFTFIYTIALSLFCALFILFAHPLVAYVFAPGFTTEGVELTAELTSIMFFYLLFISLTALCQGVLNYYNYFAISAFSPIMLNISVIAAAWGFSAFFENQAYAFAIGVIIGGVLQFVLQVPKVIKLGFCFYLPDAYKHSQIKSTLVYMLPGIFGAGVYQINIVLSNVIASRLGEGAISALNFSNRLQEFALGIFIVSLTTILLPQISKMIAKKDWTQVQKSIEDNLLMTSFLTLPITVYMILEAPNIVEVVFGYGAFDEKSVMMTTQALVGHTIGLFFIGCNRIYVVCLQSAKLFSLTAKISFAVMIVNIVAAYALGEMIGHAGVAYANSISQLFQTILLAIFLVKVLNLKAFDLRLVLNIFKHLLSCAVFAAVVYYANVYFSVSVLPLIRLILTGILAVGVFLLMCKILRIKELQILMSMFMPRFLK